MPDKENDKLTKCAKNVNCKFSLKLTCSYFGAKYISMTMVRVFLSYDDEDAATMETA